SLDTGPDVEAAYAGRINLRVSVPTGDVALTIMKLTLQENNKIRCKVQIPKDTSGKGYASTTLVVLVAPSPPVCRIVGTTEYFENINMTCASEEGSPAPTYKWQSYTVNNVPRPNPLKATDVNGLLSLYNISIDTSGFFVCTSQNKIRSATCNVTLAVMPPSMKLGSVGAALIAAAVIGLILAAIGIYCCCCRKRKEQSEEYTMG
uniref:Ig-like domain-containing protein n=1 Tax=Denticeps clupeoides TaxID=299321 RepID=A0AAY4EXD1_9TELE